MTVDNPDDRVNDERTTNDGNDQNFPLIIETDNGRREIQPHDLGDGDHRRQLEEELIGAESCPTFDLRNLLAWSSDEAWRVIGLIAGLNRYIVCVGEADFAGDVFEPVLSAMVGDEGVARCDRGIKAALYAAALTHPTAIPAACSKIAKRLKELQVDGYTVTQLRRQSEGLVCRSESNAEDEDRVDVLDMFEDAPVPNGTVVSPGWTLNATGVGRDTSEEADLVISALAPIVLTARYVSARGGDEYLGIAWLRDGEWHEQVVRRTQVADTRSIVKLADNGAPITSNNAKSVVDYLAEFEAANLQTLPRRELTSQLGWHGDVGNEVFLCGRETIRASRTDEPRLLGACANPTREIIFRGDDEGNEQLVDGCCCSGSHEAWREAVAPLGRFARVRFASLCIRL